MGARHRVPISDRQGHERQEPQQRVDLVTLRPSDLPSDHQGEGGGEDEQRTSARREDGAAEPLP